MLHQIHCDNCDRLFEAAADSSAGGKVKCPYCGDVNRIPSDSRSTMPSENSSTVHQTSSVAQSSPSSESEPERIIAVVRQGMFRAHPFWYLLMLGIFLGGAALMIFGWQASRGSSAATQPTAGPAGAGQWQWMMYGGMLAMAAGVIWWIGWWAAPHRWVKLTITSKRTIRQEGIIMRQTSEVLHRHVTNVTIRQGVIERLLGSGYIGIDSAGQGGEAEGPEDQPRRRSAIEIEVSHIPHPYRIKQIIDRYR